MICRSGAQVHFGTMLSRSRVTFSFLAEGKEAAPSVLILLSVRREKPVAAESLSLTFETSILRSRNLSFSKKARTFCTTSADSRVTLIFRDHVASSSSTIHECTSSPYLMRLFETLSMKLKGRRGKFEGLGDENQIEKPIVLSGICQETPILLR